MRLTSALSFALPLLAGVLVAGPASAQEADPVLVEAHTSLASYDVVEGGRTLRTLRDLGPLAGRGDVEARFMRAVAGAEIFAAATVLNDPALRARLATALGVAESDVRRHLDGELAASRTGTYSHGSAAARQLLGAAEAFASDPARIVPMRGPHRDALVAIALAERSERATLIADPCAEAHGRSITEPGICDWDEPSRRELGALREALTSLRRASRARSEGDPLLALLGARLDAARSILLSMQLHPGIELPEVLGVATTTSSGVGSADASLDALIVVAETELHLRIMPVVQIDEAGALRWIRGRDAGTVVVSVPSTLPAVPQAIEALVTAASGLGLGEGARVGVAPTSSVPSHLIVRTLLSMARANLTVTHLVAEHGSEAAEGHLVFVPFTTVRESALEAVDARVRIQMGGYAFGRGLRGRETRIPRVSGAGGFVFDMPTLEARLSSGTFSTVALQVMGTVPAGELIRVAFTVSTPSRAVILLMP